MHFISKIRSLCMSDHESILTIKLNELRCIKTLKIKFVWTIGIIINYQIIVFAQRLLYTFKNRLDLTLEEQDFTPMIVIPIKSLSLKKGDVITGKLKRRGDRGKMVRFFRIFFLLL